MKYFVNILNSSNHGVFLRQLDPKRFPRFEFYENSTKDIVWDYVVVYEELLKPIKIKVREGGRIFFSGESDDSRAYGFSFLKQFDCVVSTHKNIRHKNFVYSQTALNWHFGFSYKSKKFNYDFESLKNLSAPQKNKKISVITSNLAMMPGHVKRLNFLDMLKREFNGEIDFFGKGTGNFVDDKADALLPYMFHICIENSRRPHYWTEKFADPLLGFCVPIYFGDPIITDYFDGRAFFPIDINKPREALSLIGKILSDPLFYYNEKMPFLKKERSRLLGEYNFFRVFESLILSGKVCIGSNSRELVLYSNSDFLSGKIATYKLRLKRFLFRLGHKIRLC